MRLKDENIDSLYKNIDRLFRMNPDLKWWAITGYTDFDNFIKLSEYKKRKLYNGGEMCYFYRRK
jgi:23S rRNA G2445 N2-methylase RlmL